MVRLSYILIMPSRGVKTYTVKFSTKTEEIGFFYTEIIWNLLEDKGTKGITVPEIRQQSGILDATIRKILKQYLQMRRIKQIKGIQSNNLPQYKYVIKRRWLNVK